jgi:hypothetical protein
LSSSGWLWSNWWCTGRDEDANKCPYRLSVTKNTQRD